MIAKAEIGDAVVGYEHQRNLGKSQGKILFREPRCNITADSLIEDI